MLHKLFVSLIAISGISSAVLMSANPANAFVTMQVTEGYNSSEENSQTIDFNDGTAGDNFATYSNITDNIVQGSRGGEYASPLGSEGSKFLTIAPEGSRRNGNLIAGATGSVEIAFQQAVDYFGFYAGSLDSYNFIDIFSGGELVKTFSGDDVPNAIANGDWESETSNLFINLLADPGQVFDKVVMRTNGIAFETDNHAYRVAKSVPEPGSVLSILGFGAFAANSISKRQKQKLAVK